MVEPDKRRSTLIEFRKVGVGPANTVNKDGWKMKTLGQHLRDEGYWGVSLIPTVRATADKGELEFLWCYSGGSF